MRSSTSIMPSFQKDSEEEPQLDDKKGEREELRRIVTQKIAGNGDNGDGDGICTLAWVKIGELSTLKN